jgi:hypothetical protein
LEKLPIRITLERPSNTARRADGSGSNSAKMSSSTMITPCADAAVSTLWAVWGDMVAPVGLWMAELVM